MSKWGGLTLASALLFAASVFVGWEIASAQEIAKEPPKEDYVKARYTKFEYRIPMRDGKRLFTSIYVPKDTSHTYPFLMVRTPYSVSPYGVDHYRKSIGPSDEFQRAGYIFVYQDVRGRFMSEG